MSRRTKIIILIVVILILLGAIVYLLSLFWNKFEPIIGTNQPTDEEAAPGELPESSVGQPLGIIAPIGGLSPPEATSKEKRSADLIRMAMPFVERLGSYSNQSNYKNIEDLMIYMNSEMKDWAKKEVKEGRTGRKDTSIYFGVSTEALSAQIIDFNDELGSATISVSTQRRESSGSTSNARLYYQDILVTFVKEGGAWKVNSAVWK